MFPLSICLFDRDFIYVHFLKVFYAIYYTKTHEDSSCILFLSRVISF